MPQALASIPQQDFAAGMVRSTARHLIPPQGAYDLVNLLLDDDGSLYRRGGSAYLSTDGLNAAGLRFIWDGHLSPGQRTVIADEADFGVLSAAEAVVNLGGSGVTQPRAAVEIGGALVVGEGTVYGGSRKTANYSTGTIETTAAADTIVGTGTAWLANVDAGMLLRIGAERYYVVESVDSDTGITLTEPYEGTTAGGKAYTLSMLGTAPKVANFYAVVAERLIAMSGRRIEFSRSRSDGRAGWPAAGTLQWQTFDATDVHELPEGSQLLGGMNLRDSLIAFATTGIWMISGWPLDLLDPDGNTQHRVEHVSGEHVLWSHEGIVSWRNALVAPTTNGVFLIDGLSAPVELSRSIGPLIRGYARAGYKTGRAEIIRDHYFLPVLNSADALVDCLVCRLDRPLQTRLGNPLSSAAYSGSVFPWSRLEGSGANAAGFARRVVTANRTEKLLAAGLQSTARVLDCSGFFEPAAAVKNDHDASTHAIDFISRDFHTDRLNIKAFVKKLKLWYELIDAGSDDPHITAEYSIGTQADTSGYEWGEDWGTMLWAEPGQGAFTSISTQAPEDDGREPWTWRLRKGARRIRVRFRSSDPSASLILRAFELFVRPSNKER